MIFCAWLTICEQPEQYKIQYQQTFINFFVPYYLQIRHTKEVIVIWLIRLRDLQSQGQTDWVLVPSMAPPTLSGAVLGPGLHLEGTRRVEIWGEPQPCRLLFTHHEKSWPSLSRAGCDPWTVNLKHIAFLYVHFFTFLPYSSAVSKV